MTEKYITKLGSLKAGDLGLLRTHAGQRLDETLGGFDLFTGLWWPLRQESKKAPRRKVAWLIAKLYAFRPIAHSPGETLARQLSKCQPGKETEKKRFRQRFDRMLLTSLDHMEAELRWALDLLHANNLKLDWVRLTNDLSLWERSSKRFGWAEDFLKAHKEERDVD
ncbi:MAG: type I-E CRISPR-associated protein Cse2/CasB [bacterium]